MTANIYCPECKEFTEHELYDNSLDHESWDCCECGNHQLYTL